MNAYLITGQTYPHRRQLRGAGGLFDRDESGYIVRADNAEAVKLAESLGLDVEPYDATDEQLTPATGERLRAVRQDRIDRRRARLLDRAERAERRSAAARSRISSGEREFLALGEPIKVGHHSAGRHRKLVERYGQAMDESCREARLAAELRSTANWTEDARIKGDAEKRHQARRDAADQTITVGDLVDTCHFGPAIVLKVNAKSYRVKTTRFGSVMSHDKGFCKLIEKRDPVEETPAYKKGDRVKVRRMVKDYPGVILRRTPKGYSVEYDMGLPSGRLSKDTFSESDIAAA